MKWWERAVLRTPPAAMFKPTIESLWQFVPTTDGALRHSGAKDHAYAFAFPSRASLLPTMSGDECARALERCGLLRFEEVAGVIWMEFGAAFVAVPQCDVVPIETLEGILAMIGLPMGAFLEQLDTPSSTRIRAAKRRAV